MNTQQLRRIIRRELDELNRVIDKKIIRGRSYVNEARRHKQLLTKLYDLNFPKNSQRNWLSYFSLNA